MIKFAKPNNLNGSDLLNELQTVGILLDITTQAPVVDGNGDLWLDIKESDKNKASAIVAAHDGNIQAPEPTIEDKLASVGLNIADLKSALGL